MATDDISIHPSVMMSIKPKYCELIAAGKKTIEVRKTKPRIETPFKCFIYECKGKEICKLIDIPKEQGGGCIDIYEYEGCGKVIGEFVCDKIDKIVHAGTSNDNLQLCIVENGWTYIPLSKEYLLFQIQLTLNELDKYSNGGDLYGWHISNPAIYDKPKELSEFYTLCSEYEREHITSKCGRCRHISFNEFDRCLECDCKGEKKLTRPPQSWCYVVEGL